MGGGFLRFPVSAFAAIAINKILPPTRVLLDATSPRKNHTQNGPRTTSAKDKRVKSAAFSVLEPIV